MGQNERRQAMTNVQVVSPRSFEGSSHTMKRSNFLKYIGRHGVLRGDNQILGKKFSLDQVRLLQQAYEQHKQVRVVGLYELDAVHFAKTRSFEPIGKRHAYIRSKISNRHRPTFMQFRKRRSKHEELWVIVFPSRQYVDQVAELIQAVFDDFKRCRVQGSELHKGVQRVSAEHFPDIEASVAKWTGFDVGLTEYVRSGDVVAIGQVELLVGGVEHLGFSRKYEDWQNFGLDKMFSVQIYVHGVSLSRIVLVAIHHCFWGEASAHFALACAMCGATHLLYASKAGTLTDEESVGAVHSPQDFLLCEGYDHQTVVESLSSCMKTEAELERLAVAYGITATGYAVTVPTVVSETLAQRSKLTKWNPSTIDNEDAHLAKVLAKFHASRVNKARFVPVHYITDYIHRPHEKPKKNQQHLATTRPLERDKKFFCIGKFFAHYALVHGLRDYVRISTDTIGYRSTAGEHTVKSVLETCQHLLDNGLVREALLSIIGNSVRPELDAARISALALTCQKYGFIDDARLMLDLLDRSAFVLTGEDKYRITAMRIKLQSQCGHFESVLAESKTQLEASEKEPSLVEPFVNAITYRAAVAAANLGKVEEAKSFLLTARNRVARTGADVHAYATHRAFTAICEIAFGDHAANLTALSNSLSKARGQYLEASNVQSVWRANPEKSFLSALFTESALFFVYGSENDQRGWARLIAAHLFNIRIGGTERSEGFAELIYSIRDQRVQELLRLAMRMDGPGRVAFQRIPEVVVALRDVQPCLRIQKLPFELRNDHLNCFFRGEHSH